MEFNDLPKDKQEALIMLGQWLDIEAEEDERRRCTRFGYRFGGSAGLAAAVGGMVVLSGILVIALAFAAPSLNTTLATSPLFWGCFAPMLLIPFLPFVFMKPRYAFKPMMFIVIVLIVTGLMSRMGVWVQDVVLGWLM